MEHVESQHCLPTQIPRRTYLQSLLEHSETHTTELFGDAASQERESSSVPNGRDSLVTRSYNGISHPGKAELAAVRIVHFPFHPYYFIESHAEVLLAGDPRFSYRDRSTRRYVQMDWPAVTGV